MSNISPLFSRTSNLMVSSDFLGSVSSTQRQLSEAQRQISSGKALARPSDAPGKVAAILRLHQQLTVRKQQSENLTQALGVLNVADAALAEATDVVREARSIALEQSNIDATPEGRANQALIVEEQIRALVEIANRQFNGVSVFGGDLGVGPGGDAFGEALGGVRFFGSGTSLRTEVGATDTLAFTSNGVQAFGALSARVKSEADLDPAASADTPLADLGGALGRGVRLGQVRVAVNGVVTSADLTTAATLGDAVALINDAIASVDPAAGSVSIGVGGDLVLTTTGAGQTITLSDFGGSFTAADLGVALTSTGGAAVAGGDLQARLTPTTRLTDLGVPVDLAGLTISQGPTTRTADFSGATTIQDLTSAVRELDLGVRLEINAQGTGLDLVSDISGVELSVGENGGTTAADLGLRTFGTATRLADFRHGLGVEVKDGEDDFSITLHDGRSFPVNLDGAERVTDVIAAIESAAAGAGVLPAEFSVGLAPTGGLELADNTAGADSFRVTRLNGSFAAEHLGIDLDAGAGATLSGSDQAKARVENILTHLMNLRDALLSDDDSGITLAGGRLETDLDDLTVARADVGVQAKRIEDQQQRSAELEVSETTMLSDLEDADLTEVVTRFAQLQQQLSATMAVGAQNLQLSLLDFLR